MLTVPQITDYATKALDLPPSPIQRTSFLLVMIASALIGRISSAIIARHLLGPLTSLVPFAFAGSCGAFLWINARNAATFYIIASVYGVSSAGILTLHVPTVGRITRRPVADFVLVSQEAPDGVALDCPSTSLAMPIVILLGFALMASGPLAGTCLMLNERAYGDRAESFVGMAAWTGSCLAAAGVCFAASRFSKVGCKAQKI